MISRPEGWVYRDTSTQVTAAQLVDALLRERDLLSAAALECALADVDDPLTPAAAAVTDALAEGRPLNAHAVARWRSPRHLRTSVPEGFAYYALDPAALASSYARFGPAPVLVIGIRTIGTALSAIAKAAIGPGAERLTVRPAGHPYARTLAFDPATRKILRRFDRFLVVDEGPGKSGSSFLAVAEALAGCGVAPSRITLAGTHALDLSQLVAANAADRFSRFRFCNAAPPRSAEGIDLSAGRWRAAQRPGLLAWPATERQKSLQDNRLRKFAGLGSLGRPAHARAVELGRFCPPVLGPLDEGGFLSFEFIEGRLLSADDLDLALAAHLGRYIAARLAFPSDRPTDLDEVTQVNVRLTIGEHPVPAPAVVRPVICDGRLMPHEWVADRRGAIFKTDATDHGDDHFFPGPTDIAWDLAGAIVEWNLHGAALTQLLTTYSRLSGDHPRPRLPAFVIAYAAFRARFCVMAAHGCAGPDAVLWTHAFGRYARFVRSAIHWLECP